MAQCPPLGAKAKTPCPQCGAPMLRVLSLGVAVKVPVTSFPVYQYRHLKGCEEHNGHPQITSKRHLAEVCAMNNLRVDKDAGMDITGA